MAKLIGWHLFKFAVLMLAAGLALLLLALMGTWLVVGPWMLAGKLRGRLIDRTR